MRYVQTERLHSHRKSQICQASQLAGQLFEALYEESLFSPHIPAVIGSYIDENGRGFGTLNVIVASLVQTLSKEASAISQIKVFVFRKMI